MATENEDAGPDYPVNTSISITKSRDNRLDRIGEMFGESTRTEAIDAAAHNALKIRRDVEDLVDELEQEFQEQADRYALGGVEIEVSVDAKF